MLPAPRHSMSSILPRPARTQTEGSIRNPRTVFDNRRGRDVQSALLKPFGAPSFILMSALCSAAPATASDATLERIDRFVSTEMSRQHIPGMAVAVVKNGEVMLAKG